MIKNTRCAAAPRVDRSTPAVVEVKVKNSKSKVVDVNVQDGKMGGLFFYLQSRVSEGSKLELVLPVPQDEAADDLLWVRCQCRVVRVEEPGKDRRLGVGAVIEQCVPLKAGEVPRA